ncbi:MAG: response regulator [Bacteroidota bacterium]
MTEKQRHISDLLRSADREIKNGNLELAMAYILTIHELEVKNVYAKAYRERIISLFEAQGITRADAERKAALIKPMDLQSPKAEELKSPPPEPLKQEPPKYEPPKQELPKVEQKRVGPTVPPAPSAIPVAQTPPVAPSVPKPAPPVSAPLHKIKRTAAAAEAYRSLLLEIWKDGAISPEEQTRIDSMQDTFAITPDEHAAFEKEVRQTSYFNAIREEWRKGVTDFEVLRKKFRITDQEQIALEPKVFQLIQSLQSNGSVLVLDDEEPFLRIVKGVIEEGGYYCFTAVTGEEGLRLLETMTPDIVICDINFSKPNMSGFAFYEKFRSLDKFLTTPFVFLSGLDQDVLVRTGKKLGADDYLFKPIDTEMLLATIEGKLRRSRELKRIM